MGWYGDDDSPRFRAVIEDAENPYLKTKGKGFWKNMRGTTVFFGKDYVSCVLHGTEIFHYDMVTEVITLRTGGWFTPTTFRRINQCAEYFDLDFRASKESRHGKRSFSLIDVHWIHPALRYESAGEYNSKPWAVRPGYYWEDTCRVDTSKPTYSHVLKFRLVFKNLKAEEVDWRPTDTMPEDYYAY